MEWGGWLGLGALLLIAACAWEGLVLLRALRRDVASLTAMMDEVSRAPPQSDHWGDHDAVDFSRRLAVWNKGPGAPPLP